MSMQGSFLHINYALVHKNIISPLLASHEVKEKYLFTTKRFAPESAPRYSLRYFTL